eukprot:813900-Ditylum_brightwellii.AAC.1
MDYNLIGYSQHIRDNHNNIPDCFSCDFNLSKEQLTFLFLFLFSNKMMKSFRCTDQGHQNFNPQEV